MPTSFASSTIANQLVVLLRIQQGLGIIEQSAERKIERLQ